MHGSPVKCYRTWLASIVATLMGAVTYSVWASHNGASPCPMCIFQRMLFMVIIGIATLGLLLPRSASGIIAVGLLVTANGGLSVAAYQCLIQALPEIVPACRYTDPTFIERIVEWAGMHCPYLFLATEYCERKVIALLGFSWAQLTAMAFAGVSMAAIWLGSPSSFGERKRSMPPLTKHSPPDSSGSPE